MRTSGWHCHGLASATSNGPCIHVQYEERLQDQGKMSDFYKHYVDDAFSMMPNVETAEAFLSTLKDSNPSINFTMELAANGKLSFLEMEIFKH